MNTNGRRLLSQAASSTTTSQPTFGLVTSLAASSSLQPTSVNIEPTNTTVLFELILCVKGKPPVKGALCCALDAELLVWTADGGERRVPVDRFVTDAGRTVLGTGDLIRSIHLPATALRGRTSLRKIAYSPLGRSGALLAGRVDVDGFALTVTASTVRPFVLRFPTVPGPDVLSESLSERISPDDYLTDAHGAADWRRHVTGVLAEEIRRELE